MVSMEKFHHQIMEQQKPGFRAITNYSEPHRFFQGRRTKPIQKNSQTAAAKHDNENEHHPPETVMCSCRAQSCRPIEE
jgi:hypothetical protein